MTITGEDSVCSKSSKNNVDLSTYMVGCCKKNDDHGVVMVVPDGSFCCCCCCYGTSLHSSFVLWLNTNFNLPLTS